MAADEPGLLWRCGPGQAAGCGVGGDAGQGAGQRRAGVAGRGDDEVLSVVGAADGAQLAEHGVRVIEEILVDGYLDAVEFGHPGLLPAGGVRLAAGLAAAEDQQVGDDCGARCALVRAAGQPHRSGQVGQGGDLAARGGVAGIHGVPGGHHGDQAAGADQVQGLDDEVVVDAVTARVVETVGQGERAERDVADRQVETALAGPGVGERLVDDVGVRVERGRDLGGDRLELHAGELGTAGGEADEVPRSAARFQDPPAGETELPDAGPDGLHEVGVGVVRVQGVAGRRGQLRGSQQPGELFPGPGVRSPVRVEYLGGRAPAGPAGQDRLLVRCGRAVLALDGAQGGERGQVRADAGDGSGWGQVVLAAWAEPAGG